MLGDLTDLEAKVFQELICLELITDKNEFRTTSWRLGYHSQFRFEFYVSYYAFASLGNRLASRLGCHGFNLLVYSCSSTSGRGDGLVCWGYP